MRPAARLRESSVSSSVPRCELVALLVQPLGFDVQPQHGDVQRHDPGEQRGDDDDPEDAAGQARARAARVLEPDAAAARGRG